MHCIDQTWGDLTRVRDAEINRLDKILLLNHLTLEKIPASERGTVLPLRSHISR